MMLLRYLLAVTSLLGMVACSVGDENPGGPRSGTGAGSDAGGAPSEAGPRDLNSGRPAYQTKSTAQLTASVDACIDPKAHIVTPSMLRSAANPDGFLPPSYQGQDVIAFQSATIDGDPKALQTGVRPDALTLPYMSALLNIGNAAGQYCKENASLPNCDCSTSEKAETMVARCLPRFAPLDPGYAEAVAALLSTCRQNGAAAVASLVASSAFGKE